MKLTNFSYVIALEKALQPSVSWDTFSRSACTASKVPRPATFSVIGNQYFVRRNARLKEIRYRPYQVKCKTKKISTVNFVPYFGFFFSHIRCFGYITKRTPNAIRGQSTFPRAPIRTAPFRSSRAHYVQRHARAATRRRQPFMIIGNR